MSEKTVPLPHPLDLQAVARELDECAGEITERIAELEVSQIVTRETLQLEFD